MRLGYARVSTDDQNPNLQVDALRKAGCDKIFTDRGISGATIKRPQLDRCLKQLQRGDVLVVWKLDRLGRSLGHLIQTIDDLRTRGVGFQSLTEHIETNSAHGRLLLGLLGSLAEFERGLIAERMTAGRVAARVSADRPLGTYAELLEKSATSLRRMRGSVRPCRCHEPTQKALIGAPRPDDLSSKRLCYGFCRPRSSHFQCFRAASSPAEKEGSF